MTWQQIHTNPAAAVDAAGDERRTRVKAAWAAVIVLRVAWGAEK